jgi:uncharacterized OB-fold protein
MSCTDYGTAGLEYSWHYYPWYDSTPQGWRCPNCRRIFAPSMTECAYCNRCRYDYGGAATDSTVWYPERIEVVGPGKE